MRPIRRPVWSDALLLIAIWSCRQTSCNAIRSPLATLRRELTSDPAANDVSTDELSRSISSGEEGHAGHAGHVRVYHHEQTVAAVVYRPNNVQQRCHILEVRNRQQELEAYRRFTKLPLMLDGVEHPSTSWPVYNVTLRDLMSILFGCQQLDLNRVVRRRSAVAAALTSRQGRRKGRAHDASSRQTTASTPASSVSGWPQWSYYSSDFLLQRWFTLFYGIAPGTKWCGMGDMADNWNDLGEVTSLDICCRTHDVCPIKVSAFQRQYNIFNWSFYTKSHCACDTLFYNCLKESGTREANFVGHIFFDVVAVNCLGDRACAADDLTCLTTDILSPMFKPPAKSYVLPLPRRSPIPSPAPPVMTPPASPSTVRQPSIIKSRWPSTRQASAPNDLGDVVTRNQSNVETNNTANTLPNTTTSITINTTTNNTTKTTTNTATDNTTNITTDTATNTTTDITTNNTTKTTTSNTTDITTNNTTKTTTNTNTDTTTNTATNNTTNTDISRTTGLP